MHLSRREALLKMLFGANLLGLRSLASGIPAAVLADPRRALAAGTQRQVAALAPQYLILNTSVDGDPLNCNVPGTYDDPNIVHSRDPRVAPTALSLGAYTGKAALPWAQLPASILARTCFFHHSTNLYSHTGEMLLLQLNGAVKDGELLVSRLAQYTTPGLNVIQGKPISLSSNNAEALFYQKIAQPQMSPTTLRDVFAALGGAFDGLADLRSRDLDQLNLFLKEANPGPRANFIDEYATSVRQTQEIAQQVPASLLSISDDGAASQITAAIALIKMRLFPVISLHIPFGHDNHYDPGLANETEETISGVAAIANLMQQLQANGLQDQVTFASLNVFGRTMVQGYDQGRNHNGQHNCGIIIGKGVRGSVVGGVTPMNSDYGAASIDSATGAAGGDITYNDGLAAFGLTLGAAMGVDLRNDITSNTGRVVQAAVAS